MGIVTTASRFEKLGFTQAGFTMELGPRSDACVLHGRERVVERRVAVRVAVIG